MGGAFAGRGVRGERWAARAFQAPFTVPPGREKSREFASFPAFSALFPAPISETLDVTFLRILIGKSEVGAGNSFAGAGQGIKRNGGNRFAEVRNVFCDLLDAGTIDSRIAMDQHITKSNDFAKAPAARDLAQLSRVDFSASPRGRIEIRVAHGRAEHCRATS